jgi:endonuclease/exonuclease/phosphatase family metal-dependent hydrolase
LSKRKQEIRLILTVTSLVLVLLSVMFLVLRKAVGNYTNPSGPVFEGSYAARVGNFDGSLKVVTWNLHYAEKLEQIIHDLNNVAELRDADILLFQEVNSQGVKTIAQRLGYDYVYYPASFNRQRRQEYGNAILSKWPLINSTKIVLPNFAPGWMESRNSVRATISLNGREALIYCTHFDTSWLIFSPPESQAEYLSKKVGGVDDFIILGGDFNTWNPISIAYLTEQMGNVGLERLTMDTGYTFEWADIKLTLDHIFSKEVQSYQSGVYRQTDASDHYPVWAKITIGADK